MPGVKDSLLAKYHTTPMLRLGQPPAAPCRHSRPLLNLPTPFPAPTNHPMTMRGRLARLQAQPSSRLWIHRPKDIKPIMDCVTQPPSKIMCVLGPQDCGKSSLMKWLCENELQDRAMRFDCRDLNTSSPGDFAGSALSRVPVPSAVRPPGTDISFGDFLKELPSALQEYAKSSKDPQSAGVAGVAKLFQGLLSQSQALSPASSYTPPLSANMDTLMQRIKEFSDTWLKLGLGYPVIIFDEANLLYSWQQKFPEDLKVLKSNLVCLSKQEARCHFVLVSSDFGFLNFLGAQPQGMNDEWYRVLVMNGFEEDEARQFFVQQLEARKSGASDLVGTAWDSVYEVCGGNPQQLISLASSISAGGHDGLAEGLAGIERGKANQLFNVIGTHSSPSEFRLPYAKIVTAMLASSEKAPGISLSTAMDLLQEPFLCLPKHEDRIEVVRKLTAANLLMTRPRSFDKEARPELFDNVAGFAVFPPGRAMLHVMREMEDDLREELNTAEHQWKEEQQKQREREAEEQQKQREREAEEKQLRQKQLEREVEEKRLVEIQILEKDLEMTPFWRFTERGKLRETIRQKARARGKGRE